MYHAGNRCLTAVLDVSGSSCDSASCRDTSEACRCHVAQALCNELSVGAVLGTDHGVCNDCGKK